MTNVKAEIIAVGTELLLGQIANTNAQWLSNQLASLGINVYQHGVVGDNLNRVQEAFEQAQKRSDIIIVTGGLGPTDDDLTREAFQLMTELELVEHKPSMDKIQSFFEKNNTVMTPNNRRQARVFKGSQVLFNRKGMAPGMIVSHESTTWVFLPGVPREMKGLFTEEVFPYLQKLTGNTEVIKSLVLKFLGIGESELEHRLSHLIQAQKNPTIAPLAQNTGVVIRLTAKEETEERAERLLEESKRQILHEVGDYFYGINDETIEENIISLLKEKKMKIASAESLTGGMFSNRLISVSGASNVCRGGIVCYDTNVKQDVLGVSKETIQNKGTVSEECALEMAEQVSSKLDADIGISFTGVAGPDEVEGKSVGTVYIALTTSNGEKKVEKFIFSGDRNAIRRRATLKGLEIVFHFLKF
ncbi:competence/damage-inducible protein A [Oceanobacillus caeni]|nr:MULTISPECIES: competence/damage-inducible protein A [Bacillaceae]KKE78463.1 damage-inducible protein [Bacilli bacterium VT-13-104]PZD87816.1 competence/damage-inducible protein A [Bacilli bacterium]MBU8790030.1 competence/damage-inducible protein A [Oceanobacillus caeni]MCR1833189.1 competence/damage-inducible protein A [Oceanobacillus caeni]PZD88730.1 competence/damage-inducible protein A [Bacilli bacterium]